MNKSWIFYVCKRFSRVDRTGRAAATSVLATLGICLGVTTLIVIMSVMNGFQMSFIDTILEVSSYHLQVSDLPESKEKEFFDYIFTKVLLKVIFRKARRDEQDRKYRRNTSYYIFLSLPSRERGE